MTYEPASTNSKFDPEHEALANRCRNIEDVARHLQKQLECLEKQIQSTLLIGGNMDDMSNKVKLGTAPLGYQAPDRETDGGMSLAPKGFRAAALKARALELATEQFEYCDFADYHWKEIANEVADMMVEFALETQKKLV